MAQSIKDKFSGIGSKSNGSTASSAEWNGIINEIVSINASLVIELGLNTISNLPNQTNEPSVLIGKNIDDDNDADAVTWSNGGMMGIGNDVRVSGWRCGAFMHKSIAKGVSATALGYGAIAIGSHPLALGRGAHCTLDNTTMIGSVGNQNIYFANNHGISWDDLSGVGFGDATADSYKLTTIHGRDGKDQKETPTYANHKGGDLALASGRATGTAKGGRVILQSSPNSGATGNNLNALQDSLYVDSEDVINGKSNVVIAFANNPGSVKNEYRLEIDGNGFVKAVAI